MKNITIENEIIFESEKIKSICLIGKAPRTYERLEVEIETAELSGNGFDPEQIRFDVEYILDGQRYTHPCFLYKKYLPDQDGKYTVTDESKPVWRFRITPEKAGEYTSRIMLFENNVLTDEVAFGFTVGENPDNRGFLQVEPTVKKAFCFNNGEIFTPIGQNVCWAENVNWKTRTSSESTAMYERIYNRMHMFKANWTRLWLSASWDLGFFKKNDRTDDFTAALDRAARLDRIMDLAEECEMYTVMVFYYHGQFNNGGANTDWENCAFNAANPNGYLTDPADFFKDVRCMKETKQYLRYMIARYGYSRYIFSWELFNEVNFTDGHPDDIRDWHHETVEFIRKTDAHPHMVTTSSSVNRLPIIYDPVFDYINMHRYGYQGNPKLFAHESYLAFHDFDRPILIEESGINGNGVSTEPVVRHWQPWVGLMGNTPACAMEWFWDSWDELGEKNGDPYMMYRDFAPAADFAARIPRADRKQRFVSRERLALNHDRADIIGYNGEDYAYLWLFDTKYTHLNTETPVIDNVTMELWLKSGNYRIEWFDTYKGETALEQFISVEGDFVKIKAPAWSKDIAIAIERIKD